MKIYRIIVDNKFYIKGIIERTSTDDNHRFTLDFISANNKIDAALFNEKQIKTILAKLKKYKVNFKLELAGGIDYIMEYGKKECDVCKKVFELKKENKYIVNVEPKPFTIFGLREAFNCPYCGCQNIVNSYSQKYDTNTKKTQNNENK